MTVWAGSRAASAQMADQNQIDDTLPSFAKRATGKSSFFKLSNYPNWRSVDPATTIFFVVRRTEISVFIKVLFRVLSVLAHVDLKFLRCPAALPAVVVIT